MAEFDIDRFVSLSKAVDLSDIDWQEARRIGITDDERRLLRFMADTEIHTIIYLRDVLVGHTASDPEVTQFMACWAYEETHHGRALDRFLAEVGHPSPNRFQQVESKFSWREALTGFLAASATRATPHFSAAHMCWGAASELLAATSYLGLARRTRNAPLAKLVTKLARDERKHYAFYYSQAEKRLERGGWKAESIARLVMYRFWEPVGLGVGEAGTLELATSMLFGDEQGKAEFELVDEAIRRLPGLSAFHKMRDFREQALADFSRMEPENYARHRTADRTFAAAA